MPQGILNLLKQSARIILFLIFVLQDLSDFLGNPQRKYFFLNSLISRLQLRIEDHTTV